MPIVFYCTAQHKTWLDQVPAKIDQHHHYLDFQSIESKKNNQIVFRINDKNISFRPSLEVTGSEIVDNMIVTVARAVRSIFPGVMLSQVIPKVSKDNDHM